MKTRLARTKLKSRLAMVAFVAVVLVSMTATAIGVVGYSTNLAEQTGNSQVAAALLPANGSAVEGR